VADGAAAITATIHSIIIVSIGINSSVISIIIIVSVIVIRQRRRFRLALRRHCPLLAGHDDQLAERCDTAEPTERR
jgi:hypothetical protein